MRSSTRKIFSILGIASGAIAGGLLGYGVARAALPKIPPPVRYPDPASDEHVPLRPQEPTPSDAPPGPLATELATLFKSLDDDELEAARRAMPLDWWKHILAAMDVPSDDEFSVAMTPIREEIGGWSKEQVETLKSDLLGALGVFKAMELKRILEAGGVL